MLVELGLILEFKFCLDFLGCLVFAGFDLGFDGGRMRVQSWFGDGIWKGLV